MLAVAYHSFEKRNRKSEFSDLNEALYNWYQLAVSKNIYPDGRLLMEKGEEIACHMGLSSFKASNGWLDRWKTRLNIIIKSRVISGESGEVSTETVESWFERLPSIVRAMKLVTFGILMRPVAFGKHSPIKV